MGFGAQFGAQNFIKYNEEKSNNRKWVFQSNSQRAY